MLTRCGICEGRGRLDEGTQECRGCGGLGYVDTEGVLSEARRERLEDLADERRRDMTW